jgi:hypothetical protein
MADSFSFMFGHVFLDGLEIGVEVVVVWFLINTLTSTTHGLGRNRSLYAFGGIHDLDANYNNMVEEALLVCIHLSFSKSFEMVSTMEGRGIALSCLEVGTLEK